MSDWTDLGKESTTAFTMTGISSCVKFAPLAHLAGSVCLKVVDLECLPLFPQLILLNLCFTSVFTLSFV